MFLLDAMVLSETFKPRGDARAIAWLAATSPDAVRVSALTIGELERGVAKARRQAPGFAVRLETWLEMVEAEYEQRMLPVDVDVAKAWGRLSDTLGYSSPDLLIAATALVHDLIVVTRNTRHFDRTGVTLLNPYETGA